jgi:hypothetical protein
VEGELVDACELLKIDIDGKVQPTFVDHSLFQPAGRIAQAFPDVGRGKLDTYF